MRPQPVEIRILPENRCLRVRPGQSLLLALAEQGHLVRSDCGGKGLCGKCLVQIEDPGPEGLPPPDASEKDHLGPKLIDNGYRLACRLDVQSPLAIRLPQTSTLHMISGPEEPALRKEVRAKPVEPLRTPAHAGLAVDCGTTTIGLYLCDLEGQRIIASTFMRNPQAVYGADVMNRIGAARTPATRRRLQHMVVHAIESATLSLCQALNMATENVSEMIVVGNPTMVHLLVGEDPTPLGFYPFQPVFVNARTFVSGTLGFTRLKSTAVYTLPLVSGFIGSDIIAAALASALDKKATGTLLVDIGTNGEILLSTDGGFLAASCATGPAFEGATIGHGMAATDGAIEGLRIDPDKRTVAVSIIDNNAKAPLKPAGICGSGVVSAIAEMLRGGILQPDGRFDPQASFPNLDINNSAGAAFELVSPEKSFSGNGIRLTQKDIRAIQLAKGALKAGIDLLCHHANRARPHQILMAGAFGNHISPQDALTIGMLPMAAGGPPTAVGNAAGSGAVMALLDHQHRRQAEHLAHKITVVDLVHHPRFEETFIKALAFPDVK